ncbi:hypothetical protein Chor_008611 [Crotalus horridus]
MSPTPRSASAGDAKLSRLARAPWLAQEKDKAPALPTSDTADRESRHCREAREFFVAAQGQSRWLQPTQETLEAGVALPDPGEKKRGFNSKVLDLKERQEYLYCYLLPKENEHSETPEEEKQVCDQSEADWKEGEAHFYRFGENKEQTYSSFWQFTMANITTITFANLQYGFGTGNRKIIIGTLKNLKM